MKVDLNSDVGESFGSFHVGNDSKIFEEVTSVNLACGFHAGDFSVMDRSVRLAVDKGVSIGAHPGYPDLQGFGRRHMLFNPQEVYQMTLYQLGALQAFCKIHGTLMNHVKPHGALYHSTSVNNEVAEAFARAVINFNSELTLYGLSGGALVLMGEKMGLKVAHEVFADRTYQPNGTLTPRTEKNALIVDVDEAISRVIDMVKFGQTKAVDGTLISLKADTICVHGDEPHALLFVQMLRRSLLAEGIELGEKGGKM